MMPIMNPLLPNNQCHYLASYLLASEPVLFLTIFLPLPQGGWVKMVAETGYCALELPHTPKTLFEMTSE
jgi:hypothetical protein